jgi:cell division control protein 6
LHPLHDLESDSAQGDPNKFLPTPTLTLLTKKIAGMTGDVRSLFEVLRGAIDIAVAPSKNTLIISTSDSPAVSVTPTHVLAALKAYKPSSVKSSVSSGATVSNSETVTKVKNLNLQARIVLLSVLLGSKRLEAGLTLSGSQSNTSPRKPTAASLRRTSSSNSQVSVAGGMDTNQLHAYYTAILTRSDSDFLDPTTRSEFGDLLNVLEGNGLICLSSSLNTTGSGRKPFGRSASFGGTGKGGGAAGNVGSVRLVEGVWCDEILRGLGVNTTTTPKEGGVEVDVCEEEVKAIWQREQARTAREAKTKGAASLKTASEDVFSGAFEL